MQNYCIFFSFQTVCFWANVWYNNIMKSFDVLIIGGGVAGITAAVYAKRRGKKVAIVEEMLLGGQLASIDRIENFPSYASITGEDLMYEFQNQVKHLEIEVIKDRILSSKLTSSPKVIVGKKEEYSADSVIIASGLQSVTLGAGEEEYVGRGVSYCAVCDANFYKGKTVAVMSKRGSGIRGAVELARQCERVVLLDSENLSVFAENNKQKNIEVYSNVRFKRLDVDGVVKGVEVEIDKKSKKFDVSCVFVELGKKPKTDEYAGVLKLDEEGYIVTNNLMETSLKGVFACGDVRNGALKQLVTACADGAIAGTYA